MYRVFTSAVRQTTLISILIWLTACGDSGENAGSLLETSSSSETNRIASSESSQSSSGESESSSSSETNSSSSSSEGDSSSSSESSSSSSNSSSNSETSNSLSGGSSSSETSSSSSLNANNVDEWEFETSSNISFSSNGRLSSLVLGDVDFMSTATPAGFYLIHNDGDEETKIALTNVTQSGDQLTVSNGDVTFKLRINSYGNHVAIHLTDIQGLNNEDHNYGLRLQFRTSDAVSLYTLNDMMTSREQSWGTLLTLNWPYLWGDARPNGTRGSVVIYDGTKTDSELDAVLAEIWAVQGTLGHMVHPAGQTSWTRETVLDWVAQWNEKFKNLSSVSIAPENQQELYDMTENWVIPAGASRVYMFATVWRGEYHLRYLSNESVAGDAFPGGKEDLVAYGNYLAEHGAHVQLKSLVPSLGYYDERYFSDTYAEPRLLSWGSGTLVESIDTEATTLFFQPGPDYIWERDEGFVRIGNEMIHASTITINSDTGIWTLSDCERGHAGTTAKSHSAGDEVVGAVTSYNFYHFDNDFGEPDSLAEQVLDPYAQFLSDVKAGHLHFDGSYTNMPEAPWYLRNYTDYMYSRMSYPVTGSRVGGAISATFERMFPMAAQATALTNYWGIRIGPRLHGMGRGDAWEERDYATSMLDIHFDVMDRIMLDGRRPSFNAGRSGGVLDTNILENYGLIDEAYALFKDWIVLSPVYDDADAAYVASYMNNDDGGNHYEGEDVLVLSKNNNGEYIYTPHRVMGRTSGEDGYIRIDQEWGTTPRFQDIAAGTSMELYNPYDEQSPQVVIRVEEGTTTLEDPLITVNGSGTLSVSGDIQPGEYMKYTGGNSVSVYDENWNLLRSLPAVATDFKVVEGNNTVVTDAGSGSSAPDDLRVQYITLGPVYVLETNKSL